MKAKDAIFEIGKLLENKYLYLRFKYLKSRQVLKRKINKYEYLVVFSSFSGNTKDKIDLSVDFVINTYSKTGDLDGQILFKSLWNDGVYYNIATQDLRQEVYESLCKYMDDFFIPYIDKLEKE